MSEPFDSLVAAAEAQEEALTGAIAGQVKAARAAWKAAGEEASDYVRRVIRLNPTKSLDEILARSDVQQALSVPFREARTTTKASIRSAWNHGVSLGRVAAHDDLGTIKVAMPMGVKPPPMTYREMLLSDVDKNRFGAKAAFLEALSNNPDDIEEQLDKITRDYSNRAAIGANVSGHRAYNEMKLRIFAAAGVKVKKMWVTRFRPTTCRTCAKLHGSVVPLGASFDVKAHIGPGQPPKVYGDLLAPPRHPNCGCRIVPWLGAPPKTKPIPKA